MMNLLKMAISVKLLRVCTFALLVLCVNTQKYSFEINYDDNTFMKDGEPFRYISGSIHYQRVPPEYWDDRLKKMAAAGLNAIQTYVPWNAHEKMQGTFDFSYNLDIVTFLQTAQKYNLSVILRPGPYICAEWEFGGLPAWLLKYPDMKVRTMDTRYIAAVDKWLTKLYTVIKPQMHINGGPIITVQIENEYGSYPACDYDYLKFLRTKALDLLGKDVVLFTTDGDGDEFLKCGTLPDVYTTIDFGPTLTPNKSFEIQRHKEPKGPLVNSEFYVGWLDHWGQKHSTVDIKLAAKSLDLMLAMGANVNMYMFEGGTNFGFWNGANSPFMPCPTSYDYDAPLSEAGDITDNYMLLRQVISKYNPPTMKVPPSTPKHAYGKVTLSFSETILDYIANDTPVKSEYPLTMEDLDHYYGFVLYRHQLSQGFDYAYLNMTGIRDRGQLMVGDLTKPDYYGFVERDMNPVYKISARSGDYIHILVENQARINYGGQLNNNLKGFIYNITLNGTILTNWQQFPIKTHKEAILKRPARVTAPAILQTATSKSTRPLPGIYETLFTIDDDPMDTYIDMSQWTKGQLFINGVNLGRYWPHMGPQVRLYVPKFVLKSGKNQLVLLELEGMTSTDPRDWYVEFMDRPLVNGTVPHGTVVDDLENNGYSREYSDRMYKTVYDGDILGYVLENTPVVSRYPLTMEMLDHYYGFVLYRHKLKEDVNSGELDLRGVRDRAYLIVGSKTAGVSSGIVCRGEGSMSLSVTGKAGQFLHILVENQGRIGYGSEMKGKTNEMDDQQKGIISNITLNGAILTDWLHFPITMSDGVTGFRTKNQSRSDVTSSMTSSNSSKILPSVYVGSFLYVEEPEDTYIDMSNWTKGQLFINGQNMGRYWPHMGPQVRLFVPKVFLQLGWNRVILVELEGVACPDPSACSVEFKTQPLINGTVPFHPSPSGAPGMMLCGSSFVYKVFLIVLILNAVWGN